MASSSQVVAPGSSRRPVRLLDLMALIAAIAFTLNARAIVEGAMRADGRADWDFRDDVRSIGTFAMDVWTAVFLGLWIAGPRAELRSRCHDPGFAALIAVTGAALLLAGQQAVFAVIFATAGGPKGLTAFSWSLGHLRRGGDVAGPAVAGAWAVLIVSGVGRRPVGWLSWASCLLGGLWVLWWFLLPPVFYLIPLLR